MSETRDAEKMLRARWKGDLDTIPLGKVTEFMCSFAEAELAAQRQLGPCPEKHPLMFWHEASRETDYEVGSGVPIGYHDVEAHCELCDQNKVIDNAAVEHGKKVGLARAEEYLRDSLTKLSPCGKHPMWAWVEVVHDGSQPFGPTKCVSESHLHAYCSICAELAREWAAVLLAAKQALHDVYDGEMDNSDYVKALDKLTTDDSRAALDALVAERVAAATKKLREALEVRLYAKHWPDCAGGEPACACGLSQLLAKGKRALE